MSFRIFTDSAKKSESEKHISILVMNKYVEDKYVYIFDSLQKDQEKYTSSPFLFIQ